MYETEDNKASSLYQLRAYFEKIWALKDSQEFTCKKLSDEIQECIVSLNNRYQKLKETYPEAYTDWDFQKLTFETNKISLLCNPLEAENKTLDVVFHPPAYASGKRNSLSTPPISSAEKRCTRIFTDLKDNNIPLEIITNDVASGANPGDARII